MRRYLLARALERLPEDRRERYAQEWEADLAQLSRLRGLVWALGLRRAAARLARTFGHQPKRVLPLRALPQAALDAAALGGAYLLAYRLRFGQGVPPAYKDLLWHTLPFAAALDTCDAVSAYPVFESVTEAANINPMTSPCGSTSGPPELPGRTLAYTEYVSR